MNSDWPERFRELELQEMRYDIQMIECHLPDPWYRMPVIWGTTVLVFDGFGLMFLAILCSITYGSVLLLFVVGILSIILSLGIMWKYDDWTNDPCSIILDKKMYREEEEGRGVFKSHSQVNAHTLNTIEIAREVEEMTRQQELERVQAERQEAARFAALSEEEKIQETIAKVKDRIAEAICGNYTQYAIIGKCRQGPEIVPIQDMMTRHYQDAAYDILAEQGWVDP